MTWNRADLERVARARLTARASLAPVEKAALAYARWQGLTDESGVDTDAAKAALDEALAELDGLDTEAWAGLLHVSDDLGDAVVIGLMQHSLARGIAKVRETMRETQEPFAPPVEPSQSPSKKKRREKGR